ncbi:MAG: hypothetical protein ACTSU3_08165, partial [Candidatus Thorarchaeota archaeon]
MRMRVYYGRKLAALLVLTMFLVIASFVPGILSTNNNSNDKLIQPNTSHQQNEDDTLTPELDLLPHETDYSASESSGINEGVLDPVEVELSGYSASENLSARTDTYENLAYDLPIDSTHGWIADQAEVTVWNLEKLYAVNGSFNEGYPGYTVNPTGTLEYYPLGWSAISYSGDPGQAQQVSYQQGGDQYISVQNAAELTNFGQSEYTHYEGTNVTWFQIFENAPYTDQFLLQFNYLLLQGPLSTLFSGNYSLKVFIDDEVVSTIDLPTLSNRGTWFDSGTIPVTIASPSEYMTLRIGIVINADFVVSADDDYDEDGYPDGAINTQFITVYLDDVSLVKETPPSPEQVQLEFTTGGVTEPLTDIFGIYTASIENTSYWTTEPVSVALTANTSISFDYKTRLLSHRFNDSSWEPKIASTGVSYSIEHGNSSELILYSYVGYLGDYEDPEMVIVFPSDWENVTVSDPFLTLQTGTCTIGNGHITVPSSIIEYLGWWEFRFESPNYAKSISIQKYDPIATDWTDDTIYRVGNTTRTQVNIGTPTIAPTTVDDVDIIWLLPDGGEWTTETLSGGVAGQVTGDAHVLTSGSSPAGGWCVEILWTNGTEVAFDVATFEVHHSANLVGDPETIGTDSGLVVTGIVRYTDGDTGAYIMDDLATISGNWSLSTVFFEANSVKNWWEVSFDTEDIGAGNFIVKVDASRPYYDAVSCEILIISTNITRLNSPNAPWSSAEWGSEVSLTFNFEVYDSGTDTWGPVVNNSDVSVGLNWTLGYWNVVEDSTPGIYLVNVDTSAQPSGTYLLRATFEKPDHESKNLFLTLIVSPIASSLVVLGDTSARVNISDNYSLKMRFTDIADVPISSASIVIASVTPPTGLSNTSIEEVSGEPGNYSVTLTPNVVGVYAIRFVAAEANSEPGSTVFILVVNDVETSLAIVGGNSFEIGLAEVLNFTFTFETFDFTGIENASISVIYSGTPDVLFWDLVEVGSGTYNIELNSILPGTYVVTIAAFKQYYQSASDSFFLVVSDVEAGLVIPGDGNFEIGLTDVFNTTLTYKTFDNIGIENASLSVLYSGTPGGISWDLVEIGLGEYSVEFSASFSGTYIVTIAAFKQYYESASDIFFLVVRDITTNMTVLNGTAGIVSYGQDYRMVLSYTNGSDWGL